MKTRDGVLYLYLAGHLIVVVLMVFSHLRLGLRSADDDEIQSTLSYKASIVDVEMSLDNKVAKVHVSVVSQSNFLRLPVQNQIHTTIAPPHPTVRCPAQSHAAPLTSVHTHAMSYIYTRCAILTPCTFRMVERTLTFFFLSDWG